MQDHEGKHVPFKDVDISADINILSEVTWKSLKHSLPLKKTGASLFDPDQSCLKVLGKQQLLYHTREDPELNVCLLSTE